MELVVVGFAGGLVVGWLIERFRQRRALERLLRSLMMTSPLSTQIPTSTVGLAGWPGSAGPEGPGAQRS